MSELFRVRPERAEDVRAVYEINESAFGRPNEAALVDRLRANCTDILSLVAVAIDERIVGHAMFSPATIDCDDGRTIQGMALGPVAVQPWHQRQGAGGALIRAGLNELNRRGCPFVLVLGHPEYYPRFGFEPAASRHGIRSQWKVSDPVFMIRVLNATGIHDARGVSRYRQEFASE